VAVDWKDVGGKVAAVGLPILGTVLGGPAGMAAGGLVAKLIGSALGQDPDNMTAEDFMTALSNPETLVKLREIESNHALALQNIALQAEGMRLADVASARSMNVETTKATGKRDVNIYILAWLVVVLFFALTGIMMFKIIPDANQGPVNQLFGAIAAGFGMVLSYFFGSSKSSTDKTALLTEPRPVSAVTAGDVLKTL